MIKAEIITDSITKSKNRLTTFIVTYPRIILAEVNTHRMLSRNSPSSRAIPVEKVLKNIVETPFIPYYWGKNQKGMQATEELTQEEQRQAEKIWLEARDLALVCATRLQKIGVHKQIANRLLEPFAYITSLISATDWANFFNLRAHPDAQPEFQELAYQMLNAYNRSIPKYKKKGEWHLPFADKYLGEGVGIFDLLKITTARAARISYNNFNGDIKHEDDYRIHDNLKASGHFSPFEHCACAMVGSKYYANFKGWKQYRKCIKNENQSVLDIHNILKRKKGAE